MNQDNFLSNDDQALLSKVFDLDPEDIPNLVEVLPTSENAPVIIGKYDLNGTGRSFLKCAHCGTAHHLKGYVLSLPNGQHALLAERYCGRKAFGLKWNLVEAGFLSLSRRKSNLEKLQKIKQIFPAFLSELEELQNHPVILEFDRYVISLRRDLGGLSEYISKIARLHGELVIALYKRDQDAEDKLLETEQPNLLDAYEKANSEEAKKAALDEIKKWKYANKQVRRKEERFGLCAGYEILQDQSPRILLRDAVRLAKNCNCHLVINQKIGTKRCLKRGSKLFETVCLHGRKP